jgi:hypothetical protein
MLAAKATGEAKAVRPAMMMMMAQNAAAAKAAMLW